MSAFGALDRGTRIAILLLGGAVVAGVGYLGWQLLRPVPPVVETVAEPAPAVAATDDPPALAAAPADPAVEPVAAAPEVEAETVLAPAPEPVMPKFDTWRVAADGEAVVSGRAAPGATIEIIVDDLPVAGGVATASGEFAILFTLAPNPRPSLMWLSMILPDMPAVASEEMVALGPIDGPKLAEAAAPAQDQAAAATQDQAAAPTQEQAAAPAQDQVAAVTQDQAAAPAQDQAAAPTQDQVAAAEEPVAPSALLLSEEGAVVLQDPATPEPVAGPTASVMIDTITYTPEGEVQVGGRGAGGAALRLYLDNAEKATVLVPGSGLWRTTLPDTAPGIYTLRVDQLDAGGKVTSRFETPFKRETLEALAAVANARNPEPATQDLAGLTEAPVQPPVVESVPEVTPESETAEPTAPQPIASGATETASAPEAPAAPQADAAAAAPEAPVPVTVTVQPGFTLWGIAQERYGDGVMYVQVFESNRDKIKDPDLIYPGQVFSMPEITP